MDHVRNDKLTRMNTTVPILKLNRDLLWRIFMINAELVTTKEEVDAAYTTFRMGTGRDFERDVLLNRFNALTTNRRTSQVCTQWRDLMISSPSLWGRSIDISHLNQKHSHWRNEVLRRSGQSLLHVRGGYGRIDPADFADILLHILDTEWARIQTLDVDVPPKSISNDPRWSALQRPAPLLHTFNLYFAGVAPSILSTFGSIMFSDHAPALEKFILRSNANILFKTPSSFLFPIRHFDIGGPFTVAQLSGTLPQMLRLEYLHLNDQNTGLDSSSPSLPHIHFPCLKYIHLESTFSTCLTLLEHITTAPGCSLLLSTCNRDQIQSVDSGLLATLSRYAKVCFNSHSPLELSLNINDIAISLSCKKTMFSPEFLVRIVGPTETSLPPKIHEIVLRLLSFTPFNKLTSLMIFGNYIFQPSNPIDVAFMSSLSALETLETYPKFLEYLMMICDDKIISDDERPFFPLLKTLKSGYSRTPGPNIDVISKFLFQRQELGVPIAVLNLIGPLPEAERNLGDVFDGLDGLRVCWTEY